MSTRRLANSNPTRFRAFTSAKELKDSVPPPTIIPFSADTINRLDLFFPIYKSKIEAGEAALELQFSLGEQIKTAKIQAEYLIVDFFDALQRAIRRKLFDASVRTRYGLAGTDANLPLVRTEADISFWGGKAATGEAARTAAGGAPITFPSIAEVDAAVNAFKTLNQQQASAKISYDMAQEAIATENPEADKLILKMWNEIETRFDEGDKPSMRAKAREWGVVYIPTAGQAPSPEDFSIMGKVTDKVSSNGLADVELKVVETGNTYLSESDGNFFIPVLPPGNYTLEINKTGYASQTMPGIVVSTGVITTKNIELTPAVATGTVSGTVLQAGMKVMGATVSVNGFPLLMATTDMNGNYTINNVPAGMQAVMAKLPSSAMPPQTQNVNVMAGAEVNASFNF